MGVAFYGCVVQNFVRFGIRFYLCIPSCFLRHTKQEHCVLPSGKGESPSCLTLDDHNEQSGTTQTKIFQWGPMWIYHFTYHAWSPALARVSRALSGYPELETRQRFGVRSLGHEGSCQERNVNFSSSRLDVAP